MTMRVEFEGLKELRRDLRRAEDASPRELTRALKDAGEPLLKRSQELASEASRSGEFERGFAIRAAGTTGRLINRAPHAAGAHWGVQGKWRGFSKYGPRGKRFGHRALDETRDKVAARLLDGLRDIVTVYGWFATR